MSAREVDEEELEEIEVNEGLLDVSETKDHPEPPHLSHFRLAMLSLFW
jgi:hypothetical protein